MNKPAKRIFKFLLAVLIICILRYIYNVLQIVSGYGAKNLCSAVFVAGRTPADAGENELGSLPFSLGTYSINYADSSVTGTVFGFAKKKAIYQEGLGAVLVNGISEKALREIDSRKNLPELLPASWQDSVPWPAGNFVEHIPSLGKVDTGKLEAALNTAFTEPANESKRRTKAVIVVYDGNIVAERYANGYSADSKLQGWSMTKSIINALLGILTKQGKLDVHRPAPIPGWQNDARKEITILNLMQMNSGLSWWDFYLGPSDATNMLFNEKSMDDYAEQAALETRPGEVFEYSGGSANILSGIIRQSVGDRAYYRFPYLELFHKIGMYHTVLEPDAGGTFVGSSYCYASARDWARFGLLYLNDGIWNGQRILPEGWVKFTTTPAPGKTVDRSAAYGALWWLNRSEGNDISTKRYPHVPEDCFSCEGYEGQTVWVIPSKKLVVVRLSQEEGNKLNKDKFMAEVIEALP